jgi:hypothetical protein
MSEFVTLPPTGLLKHLAKVLATPVGSLIYRADRTRAAELIRPYSIGAHTVTAPLNSWKMLERRTPGLRLVVLSPEAGSAARIPFVYESPEAEFLKRLRSQCHLDRIIERAQSEYDAMLRLGAWLGSRWDHGTDPVPGGNQICDPVAVIAAGERGAKFWCEIAARTAVHAATALGWPARVITGSRDGYTWEHAVAEFWSNQFDKWFVIDTDFNVVYECAGIPLSAFELTHRGESLQRSGELHVRAFSAAKPTLPYQDVMPFYKYIHVDLRNDWCSRTLPRASPAGGDLATWWTSRPDMKRLVTAKTRVDEADRFDWKLNSVAIRAVEVARSSDGWLLTLSLQTYSPMFRAFSVMVDGNALAPTADANVKVKLAAGRHAIEVRSVTAAPHPGPPARVEFELTE